jgi:DNA adenine methylase
MDSHNRQDRKRTQDRMTYPGGKAAPGVYQSLINLMPPHKTYVEPFLGAGALMRIKRPAGLNIGIDIDPEVIQAWEKARQQNAYKPVNTRKTDKRSILESSSPRPAITAAPAETGERRRREILELESLVLPSSGGSFEFWQGDAIQNLSRSTERLWCSIRRSDQDTLIYCDPPYLHSTRGRRDLYQFEMRDDQHRDLLSLIRELPCMVMISGYSSPMYAKALKGWNAASFQTGTRGGRPAAEWVWYNYPRPVALHDYRFLGKDFREREKFKRRRQRLTARLQRMPTLERQALLAAIADTAGFVEVGPHR